MTGVRLKPGVSPGSSRGSSGSPPLHQDRPQAALRQPFDYTAATAANVGAAGRLQPDAEPRQPLNSDAASAGPEVRQQSHNQGGAPAAELQQPYDNPAAAASSEVAPRHVQLPGGRCGARRATAVAAVGAAADAHAAPRRRGAAQPLRRGAGRPRALEPWALAAQVPAHRISRCRACVVFVTLRAAGTSSLGD